jgi:thiamine pyrophosphokinase
MSESESRAVIFANGSLPDLKAVSRLLRPDDTLLAADGGSFHLLALGLLPSAVIGDLDSLSAADHRRLEAAGVCLLQHPRDKDETDLELALRHAVDAGHRSILIVGALGGRLDQTLGNLSLLADPALEGLEVRLDDGVEEAFFVRGGESSSRGANRGIHGRPGEVVSLLPWGALTEGVTTDGLRWPLCGETLFPHKTRGISNELLGETASVTLTSGLLLVVHRRNLQS